MVSISCIAMEATAMPLAAPERTSISTTDLVEGSDEDQKPEIQKDWKCCQNGAAFFGILVCATSPCCLAVRPTPYRPNPRKNWVLAHDGLDIREHSWRVDWPQAGLSCICTQVMWLTDSQ